MESTFESKVSFEAQVVVLIHKVLMKTNWIKDSYYKKFEILIQAFACSESSQLYLEAVEVKLKGSIKTFLKFCCGNFQKNFRKF